jgi:hypothetical protein
MSIGIPGVSGQRRDGEKQNGQPQKQAMHTARGSRQGFIYFPPRH